MSSDAPPLPGGIPDLPSDDPIIIEGPPTLDSVFESLVQQAESMEAQANLHRLL